jgi:hypothetical protein
MASWSLERREPDDPWRGRQPRYEKLVYHPPRSFFLITRLPSDAPIGVRLRRVYLQQRRSSPRASAHVALARDSSHA